ncbi:MAG: DUF364 domain-containing protein [Gammaproteobacteria bacterium]|nr:DUF364 domain-containing protein [Gammaproteobacteria bacterium]MDH3466023.1 DUF364 domain-containing protein [Gammaproteobacteria bacterium]
MEELRTALCAAAEHLSFPAIDRVVWPRAKRNPCKSGEFALVVLDDGSAGLFYVWLDDTLERLVGIDPGEVEGLNPAEYLAAGPRHGLEHRALALGVMNAMSQWLFCAARIPLSGSGSMGDMAFTSSDKVGMVGLFPSLADRLQQQGTEFVVVEKDTALRDDYPQYTVSMNPQDLLSCTKILITGSTLLNDSLDDVLAHCAGAKRVSVIGPTASCLPDALFRRGVHRVGGSRVVDLDSLLARQVVDQPWGDAVQKYVLDRNHYPGLDRLLSTLD